MKRFTSFDGTSLAYEDTGSGPAVLLLHGFGASAQTNWIGSGVQGAILHAGFRAIAPDARGHGRSDKPHDVESYSGDTLSRDVSSLLDELQLSRVAVVAYSMGALTTLAATRRDARITCAALGGIGYGLTDLASTPEGRERREVIARALETDDPSTITVAEARLFRSFIDLTGGDRLALAALQRVPPPTLTSDVPIEIPLLFVVGESDNLAGDPAPLAARYAKSRILRTPGDHVTAVAQPALREAVVQFLVAQHAR